MRSGLGVLRVGLVAFVLVGAPVRAAIFTVTNTNDSGAGSLRQAILAANATAVADTIRFNIPGSGVHTISPTSALPTITSPVTIDGGTELIELSGANAPAGTNGLHVTAGNSLIQSITINRFQPVLFGGGGHAIVLETGGGNSVFGCHIGTNPAGTVNVGNGGIGISVSNSSSNVIGGLPGVLPLRRNVISGGFVGVFVSGSSPNGNQIPGNRIGTDGGGTLDFGNTGDGVIVLGGTGNQVLQNLIAANQGNGILVSGSATATLVQSNLIGTTASGAAGLGNGGDGVQINAASENTVRDNTVARSGRNGVLVFNGANSNLVQGNFVGTNASGAPNLGNAGNGIIVSGANGNTIGGVAPADRNVVCDNGTNGIRVRSGSAGNIVAGNLVGITSLGTRLGNGDDGIEVNDAATGNTIGGTVPGAGNVISGSVVAGIRIADATTTGNVIQGNRIGTNTAGAAVPNLSHGVWIEKGAHDNTIGGAAAGAGNTIAFNGGDGVLVEEGTGNAILGNEIRGNGGLGIDLAPDGVTPNDPGDTDGSPNRLQNFPDLASAISVGPTTTVQGSLNSLAATRFRVEFFASVLCDASGHGEGRFFLGSAEVTTDGSGNASIDVPLPVAARGPFIAATATDPLGNTSEFSVCVMVPGPTVASVAPTSGPPSGGTPVTITGSNFQDGAAALFGGSPAGSPLVQNGSQMTATAPAVAPGTLNDVAVVNPSTLSGMLPEGWFADFSDVPQAYLFHGAVEKIFRAGITSGCGAGNYCPGDPVNRAGMAAFLLRGEHGGSYQPPDPTGQVFGDVPLGTFLGAWIEQLAAERITTGCGGGNYCPDAPVTRAGMAVFLLRAKHGADYHPPAAEGDVFDDVPLGTFLGAWIEQLAAEQITSGCGERIYCPEQPVTRGEMAVFLVRTFGLN